jgi:CheY-like chemotaxis protein
MRATTPKTVLVIDDDDGLQESLEALLEMEGYQVLLARDGIQALEVLKTTRPALILLDLMMPRMNGYELVEQMRQQGYLPGIPIIVLTADVRARQKAAQLGAESFVTKPFELDDLLQQIQRLAS